MLDEFAAVVRRQRFAPVRGNLAELSNGRRVELAGRAVGQAGDEQVTTLAFDAGGQTTLLAEHGVGFPVADLSAALDMGRTVFNADAIGNPAATDAGTVLLSAELLTLTKAFPKRSAGLPIRLNVLVDAGMADAHSIIVWKFDFDSPGDLLRRPFLTQLLQHIGQERPMLGPAESAWACAALTSQPLGAVGEVLAIVRPAWMAMEAFEFAANGSAMALESAADLGQREITVKMIDANPLALGKMRVRHRCLALSTVVSW